MHRDRLLDEVESAPKSSRPCRPGTRSTGQLLLVSAVDPIHRLYPLCSQFLTVKIRQTLFHCFLNFIAEVQIGLCPPSPLQLRRGDTSRPTVEIRQDTLPEATAVSPPRRCSLQSDQQAHDGGEGRRREGVTQISHLRGLEIRDLAQKKMKTR